MAASAPGHSLAEHTRPASRRPALTAVCAAVVLAQLDTSVVNVAARPIGDYFRASVGALQWVVDIYNLVYAALLLTGGLLADLYGRRRMFLVGAAVFTAASALCAVAMSVPVLIGARALAGLGAALLLPASLAIIRVLWPDPVARGKVLGLWAGCNGLALAMGPTLGGLLMHALGWRSIFYVVIPFGGALALIAASALPESCEAGGRRFDVVGQVFGAAALAGAAVAAIQSHHAPIVAVVAAVGAAVALAVFLANERRLGDGAMVPLGLFRAPAFTGAMAATASMTFGMYGVLFLLPLAWQQAEMLGPVGAGVALIPMALAFVLVSPLSGALTARVGTPVMASGGVAIAAAGLVVVAVAAARASMPATMVALAMTGVGTGLATGPLLGAAIAAVPAPRAGTAAALINVARMVGATGGVAVLGAIFALDADTFAGLQHALLVGAGLQLAGAAVASLTTGRQPRSRGKPNATS